MSLDEKRVQLLDDYGIANAADCVKAQRGTRGVDLSDCVALLENESGGRNIFGSEGTACPSDWYEKEVTQTRYTFYKIRRNLGYTVNGVGPTQLTDAGLQKLAEDAGGCWKPLHNMEIGFDYFGGLVITHGLWGGAMRYNGSGAAAENYANRLVDRAMVWHGRFTRAGLAGVPTVH